MFRVLQIKCRLHESQMRERDVRVSIDRFFRGGEMTRSVFVQTMKARILLVDLVKKEGILLFLLFFCLSKKGMNSTVSTVFI